MFTKSKFMILLSLILFCVVGICINFKLGLQPKQVLMHRAINDTNRTARYFGYGGAKFGGKSYFGRNEILKYALQYAGLKCLILRKTYDDLVENHVNMFFIENPWIMEFYNRQDHAFYLPNGSVIKLGYLENEKDAWNYWGKEFHCIFWDEAQQGKELWFKILATANRVSPEIIARHPTFKPWFLMGFNWGDVGHAHLKRLFYDRQFTTDEKTGAEENPADYHPLVQALYQDNRKGMEANPDYMRTLKQLPPEMWRAHGLGDPNAFIGRFFSDLTIVPNRRIPDHWDRYRAIDWGFYPGWLAVGWVAVDPVTQRHEKYREMYVQRYNPDQAGDLINKMSEGESYRSTVGSPDMWAKNQHGVGLDEEQATTHSIASELQKKIGYIKKANDDRRSGWIRVKTVMYCDKEQQIEAQFVVQENCKHTQRVYPLMQHAKEGDPEDMEKKGGVEDHLCEADRYCLMEAKTAYPPKLEPQPIQDRINRMTRPKTDNKMGVS